MASLSAPPSELQRVLDLARRDRAEARRALADLPLDTQVALVCAAPVARRAELLDLVPAPEELVPRLPEAELCFTVKAAGLESSAWMLEHATPQQIVACLDLDAWRGDAVVPSNLDLWLDALAETSDDALLRSLQALDPELLVLYLSQRVTVSLRPNDDEGWEPPAGARTLDGQFYLDTKSEGDDAAAILRLLHLLFQRDYWTYFRMLQAVIWEPQAENEEWALRWRMGRLEDLGFPRWEEAMQLYGFLPPAERAAIPAGERPLAVDPWHLPVWLPSLPESLDSEHLVFRTLARMEPEERRAAFYAFVAVANEVAVADRMELSEAETTPRAIEKAATWISRGLEHTATRNRVDPADVLRRVPLEHLFRVGANLDPEAARPPAPPAGDREEAAGEDAPK